MRIDVVDNGGQWTHREWRVLRYLDIETKIIPNTTKFEDLEVDGLVLSGGAPRIGTEAMKLGNTAEYLDRADFPILGICVGAQFIALHFGGKADAADIPEVRGHRCDHNRTGGYFYIVGDVGVDHQQAVVADDRGVVGHQRPMDRHVLANGVVRADHHAAGLGGNVDVLGKPAEDGALEHVIVGPQGRSFLDHHAALQDAAGADHHARFDDAEGTDLDVRR